MVDGDEMADVGVGGRMFEDGGITGDNLVSMLLKPSYTTQESEKVTNILKNTT